MSLDTQAIRERLKKATTHRGKWIVRNETTVGVEGLGDICEVKTARFEPSTFHNAEFIAHAPSDIEALLNELEKGTISSENDSVDLSRILETEYRFLEKLINYYGANYIQQIILHISNQQKN